MTSLLLCEVFALFVVHVGSTPENITLTFLTPTSVRVSWSIANQQVADKYDVMYKPTDASYRVVAIVAGNTDTVTLHRLQPSTQYQLTVIKAINGKKIRSRPIVFRTLEENHQVVTSARASTMEEMQQVANTSTTVRGIEILIVLLVLLVWICAISLFFHRWGKIRMLLPFQPEFKQEFKVPGGHCGHGGECQQHSQDHSCCCCCWSRRHQRPSTQRDCGCQFALLHRADVA